MHTTEEKRAFLTLLTKQKRLSLRLGHIFDTPPPTLSMPNETIWDRIEGMMIGLAIGDALGNTSEGSLPETRRARHGEITDYLYTRHAPNNTQRGVPSDDTQLAFWTLQELITFDHLEPDAIAERFATETVFGQGHSIRDFRHLWRSGIRPWYKCAPKSAGNGALMRIAPILIPYWSHPSADLWYDTALLSIITHMDGASVSACIAFVNMLWHLLDTANTPDPTWWTDAYIATAQMVEADPNYQTRTAQIPYRGLLWQFAWQEIQKAHQHNWTTLQAANRWYSGAYLLETVPTVLYILSKHGHDPEQAVIRAVNDTKDNDTIGALVGTAMGALYGKNAFPKRWIDGLTGRTKANDNGAIFDIINQAKTKWGPRP